MISEVFCLLTAISFPIAVRFHHEIRQFGFYDPQSKTVDRVTLGKMTWKCS